jgi:isoleucyl-tRNA synthetase
LPELEKARQGKVIGKALEAQLRITANTHGMDESGTQSETLRELLNVSQLEIASGDAADVAITVSKASGGKCERCWHWEADVGMDAGHPTVCERCVEAVKQAH